MKFSTRIALFLTLASLAGPSAPAADPVTITSRSRQFVVRGLRQTIRPPSGVRNANLVRVDPALLAVTSERIKDALQAELGWGERWRGKIFIEVHPLRFDNETVTVTAALSPEGWNYLVQMPDELDPARLVRAIVSVLLLEFSNRGATGPRSAELPPWLAPGLTAHLLAGPLTSLTVEPGSVTHRHEGSAPLAKVRARLLTSAPLTVDQLNWPEPAQFEGEAAALYESCAHLYVRELLRLRAGPDCLCAMLALLPEHLNWQTSFLRAFDPHFHRMLDVEKWWSVNLVHLTGHTPAQLWAVAESRVKLDEILYTPVEVRLKDTELGHATFASLQTIIEDWDYRRQKKLLREKSDQLAALRLRLAHEVTGLAGAYRQTLVTYLERRDKIAGANRAKTQEPPNLRLLVTNVLRELDRLDAERDRIRTLAAPATNAPAAGPVESLTGRGRNL